MTACDPLPTMWGTRRPGAGRGYGTETGRERRTMEPKAPGGQRAMRTVTVYAVLAATPAAAFWGLAIACERLTRFHRTTKGPVTADRSIEQLAQDLRRLGSEQRGLRHSDQPAKVARLHGVMLAYDDTLVAACVALDLPGPGEPPLDEAVRLETELALTGRGLVW